MRRKRGKIAVSFDKLTLRSYIDNPCMVVKMEKGVSNVYGK
jgi:hypothetical protein